MSLSPFYDRQRATLPARMKSHEIDVMAYETDRGMMADLVRDVNAKLAAEDERMRRILPDPPPGFAWHGEIQSAEHIDFKRDRGDVTYRIVYRLHNLRTGETLAADPSAVWREATEEESST